MDNSIKITLIIVVGVLVLALLGFYVYNMNSTGNTISANGISQIKAMPDLVGIYFNIETTGATSKEANDKNSIIVDNLITSLIKLGFERKDIVTQSFSVNPEYDWSYGKQTFKDYRAVNSIRIEFSATETSKIGDVIDAGINAGATISYINFELSTDKQNEYKALALKQATEDARIKAEGMASGLGKSLGRVVSVSSSEFNYYPWRMYDTVSSANLAEAKTATTSIQPGEQDVNAQVSVMFKIR